MATGQKTSKIPTAASEWTQDTINALGAEYDRHNVMDTFPFDKLTLLSDIQNRNQISLFGRL
jgi:hypothetical protein